NWNKSEALLCLKWTEGKTNLPDSRTWRGDGFKYLGVFLGDDREEKVKDPPPLLLDEMQAVLLDFFRDNLHWVPQSVLWTTAFRLQFLQ
ncbi:SH3 and multiple ankyrin repeat domains protein 2-like, partial [Tachysurus ichikawai]